MKAQRPEFTLEGKLAKALLWSVALYGCGWTLRQKGERMIEVTEGLLEMVKKRKLAKYQHLKKRGDSLVLLSKRSVRRE